MNTSVIFALGCLIAAFFTACSPVEKQAVSMSKLPPGDYKVLKIEEGELINEGPYRKLRCAMKPLSGEAEVAAELNEPFNVLLDLKVGNTIEVAGGGRLINKY